MRAAITHLHRAAAAWLELQRCRLLLSPGTDEEHLEATVAWLVRAQDVCQGRGVSILFDAQTGWADDPYPETSGYILGTFLKYAELTGKAEFYDRAITIGDWEIEIQRADGAVLSSVRQHQVRVFNTGQVILGWCALFEATGYHRYREAATRAGRWLRGAQESDGSWVKDTYCGARTYHSRVAWALLRLGQLSDDPSFAATAWKNIDWVLRRQNRAGWFANCGFDSDPPITHVIGYTIRGLLESHQIAGCGNIGRAPENLWPAVVSACRSIASCVRKYRVGGGPGLLPGAFTESWQPAGDDTHSCLTGNAQLAVCLMRFATITGERDYADAAFLLIDALKELHYRESPHEGIRGAVAGSFPFHRGYLARQYPNWAAKFFADALLMRINLADGAWVKA